MVIEEVGEKLWKFDFCDYSGFNSSFSDLTSFIFNEINLKKGQIDVIRLHQKVIYIKKCLQEMTLKETWPPAYGKAMKATIGSYLKVVENHQLHCVRWRNRSEKNHSPSYDFFSSNKVIFWKWPWKLDPPPTVKRWKRL